MDFHHERQIIATVWRPEEIRPGVVRMARATGTKAIFDLSQADIAAFHPALLEAAGGDAAFLKISPAALMDEGLPGLLQAAKISGFFVEIHPLLLDGDPGWFLHRLEELSARFLAIPILSDVGLIFQALDRYPGLIHIALKGCEAAGLVSTESIFSLYAALRDRFRDREEAPALYIWGSVATPEAAAAFLSTGARGIVLESLHWLTDLVQAGDPARQGLAKLRPDHTQLVGLNLEAPYRVFNKGNSLAVRKLQEWAASGPGGGSPERRRAFMHKAGQEAVHPLGSRFHRDELIPLGVEAAFAQEFADRYGSATEAAMTGFLADVASQCTLAPEKARSFLQHAVAAELGCRYPFIQGAMTWITDVPAFAREVADAGGLPTLALGLMDPKALEEKWGGLKESMGDRPFAVNLIALPENPHRDDQLAWIKKLRPRFAVIAAGDPHYGAELRQHGLEVMYLAPNEDLVRLAGAAGVRYLILEGNEAGGHVGLHTTLTLAQIALSLKRREPDLLKDHRLILAGGIYNRKTAFMAAMLGADAIQMGTAYLATREIVETGALTALYQQMVLKALPGATAVTGEAAGLRVRSLKTPVIDRVAALERDFLAQREDEASFRQKMEALAAGSLLIAARGVAGPDGAALPEETCLSRGQFMSGACAGAINRVQSVADLHRDLAEGPLSLSRVELKPGPYPGLRVPRAKSQDRERLAITGMSVVNALGNSPEEVWAASLAMQSGITWVPLERWDHRVYYDPRPRTPEKTYCRVGAFQRLDIHRKDLGIAPQDFRTMTPATRLTLWLAARAIGQSGILEADIPRERIAVLISQNSGEAAATLRDLMVRGSLEEIFHSINRVMPLSPELKEAIAREVTSGRLAIDDTTLLGRLNCTAAGFITQKYGFMGPSYAVSAACATSLVALYTAIQMIRNGIIDAAIVGGGEENLTPMHFLEFSALGALAGISGQECLPAESSRPFDRTRDGMVLGEGGGMIVVERESLARRRGARVHAYITAAGASNSHQGLVESSREVQEIAIRASFHDAPYGPEAVDLVECHATATFQGDVEEVHALKTFFQGRGRTVLSSFKSQIGHNLGASGLNSLIRGIMAMRAKTFPPTLNYHHPDPEMAIEGSGLLVATEPLDWPSPNGLPRRFQVNSFGFGGSNYVTHLEEPLEEGDMVLVSAPEVLSPGEPPIPGGGVPEGIACFQTTLEGAPYRVVVVADSAAEARSRAEKVLSQAGPEISPKTLRMLGRQGLFLEAAQEEIPPLALVFPGQGAQYQGMGYELYRAFPVIRHWLDQTAEWADFDLLNLLFRDREEDLQKTRWQQPATFSLELAMAQYLLSLGLQPAAMAGHSLGELTALATAGVFGFEDGFRLVNKRAQCMDKACALCVDPGIMIATDAPLELVEREVRGRDDIYFTNYNAPQQVVLGGGTQALQALREEIKARGYRATQLRVSMAFHSPLMRVIRDELEEFVGHITFHPPRIPVISNTTRRPYPSDPMEIKKIIMAHLESPVYWMENVRTLWQDYGIRFFLEVGPGDTMSNLIGQTLEEPQCLPTCLSQAEVHTLKTALGRLLAGGYLPTPRPLPRLSLAPAPQPRLASPVPAGATPDPVGSIIQREINVFVLKTFGEVLKPNLLQALRREYDPQFSEEHLEHWLSSWSSPPGGRSPDPVPGAAAAVPEATPPPVVPPPQGEADLLEEVIRLIMEATGYERDEIEPDMDLRADLAIRSSRIPVIMDAAETRFGVQIRLEDFLNVRTVRDLAVRLQEVMVRGADQGASRVAVSTAASLSGLEAAPQPRAGKLLKRLTFSPIPLPSSSSPGPVEFQASDTLAILTPKGDSVLGREVQEFIRREYGAATLVMAMLEKSGPETLGFDLRSTEEAHKAARLLQETSVAGLLFILDETLNERLRDWADLIPLLSGCFALVQALTASPHKKLALALNAGAEGGPGGILIQGLLGLFLSATLEYPEVQFRNVRVDNETDLRLALSQSLDFNQPVIDTIYRQGGAFTLEGRVALLDGSNPAGLVLNPGDVLVFSGGGYGITAHLARSLAPFQPRLVLLGRTPTEFDPEINRLILAAEPSDKALRWEMMKHRPDISQVDLAGEVENLLKARTVLKTLDDLRSGGLDVAYFPCDVTDPGQVQAAIHEIGQRYGRIDGIVHGAGILRDRVLSQMSPEEFAAVCRVKLLGALNLFAAAAPAGLRFLVALSSAAAIQGNRGQANYTAANRMMSALLEDIRRRQPHLRCKALMLPPVSGSGMAADPEVRHFLEKMGVGYFEPAEVGELFRQELFFGKAEDVWVMFMTQLPKMPQVALDATSPAPEPKLLQVQTMRFPAHNFPLVDTVLEVDYQEGLLRAARTFSWGRDLWLPDHKPFKFLKHPLVSTIMALEAFMEVSRLLYPYLQVRGVRHAEFREIIECPPDAAVTSEITCRGHQESGGEVICRLTLETPMVSPSGRALDRKALNYRAQVILDGGASPRWPELSGFPVNMDDLDTRPAGLAEISGWYDKHTDMQGRYRVMEHLDGSGPGKARGAMSYRDSQDFVIPGPPARQYPAYVLEGVMHLVNFYYSMRDEDNPRTLIPVGIEEMVFSRPCRDGEKIILEALLREEDSKGVTWDGRALDAEGQPLMVVTGLRMQWFNE